MPVWPDAGLICGFKTKCPAYRAAAAGHIPTVRLSERRIVVPTAALRTMLGLPVDGPAIIVSGAGEGVAGGDLG